MGTLSISGVCWGQVEPPTLELLRFCAGATGDNLMAMAFRLRMTEGMKQPAARENQDQHQHPKS